MNTERFNRYFKATPTFRIENPNPRWATKKGIVWDTGDCAIRALANSLSCTWLEAFDFLTAKARRDYAVVNDGPFFRKWMKEGGAEWVYCKAVKGKRRMTCQQFAETHKKGRYVVYIANHFTTCVDGTLLDAFKPSDSAVVGYFDMANFKLQ